jgi:hypothetical protein
VQILVWRIRPNDVGITAWPLNLSPPLRHRPHDLSICFGKPQTNSLPAWLVAFRFQILQLGHVPFHQFVLDSPARRTSARYIAGLGSLLAIL